MNKKELVEILEAKWKGTKEALNEFLEDKKYFVQKVLSGTMSMVILVSMLTACQPIKDRPDNYSDTDIIGEEIPGIKDNSMEEIREPNVPTFTIAPEEVEGLHGISSERPVQSITDDVKDVEEEIVEDEEIIDDEEVIEDKSNSQLEEREDKIDTYDGVELLTRGKNTINYNYEEDKVCVNNSDFKLSEELLKKFYKAIDDYDYKLGFYITDPKTKMTISYNAEENFSTASTVKAAMALYAMKVIDTGKYSLDDTMVFENKHVYKGGTRQKIYYKGVGAKLTLKDVIYYTIHNSDNEGYLMLMDKFGIEGYNEMVEGLGCNTWVGKKGLKFGYFTPEELNNIWQEIYAYTELDTENSKWFKDLFINAKFNFTKEQMPDKYEDIDVAHKSGFSKLAFNDSSIMYFEDGSAIMTIMTNQGDANRRPFRKFIPLFIEAWEEYKEFLKVSEEDFDMENDR